MRKFKFMPQIAAGMLSVAMVFGSLSGLVVNSPRIVYAATAKATSIQISGDQVVAPGGTATYTASISYEGAGDRDDTVKWEVSGKSGASTTINATSGALTIDAKETAEKLVIKATSTATTSVSAEFEVIVGTGASFEIDYESMTGSISSNGDDEFFFLEVLKDEKGEKPGTVYCYEGDEATGIDLSFLKITKPVSLRVYGNKNPNPLRIYTLAKQDKKPSIKYVAGKDTFYETFQLARENLTDKTVQTLEWSTQYGDVWSCFESLEDRMSSLTVAGSTILVRAISPAWDAPATAEVKVKIAAVPKAPKVTLDYAKNSIKLPKGSEIRVPGWIIPSEEKPEGATAFSAVETPFYFTVGSNKEDQNISPMNLAEKLVDQYIKEYNEAQGKITDTAIKAEYPAKTTEDTKDTDGNVTKESDKTVLLKAMKEEGYNFLVRTAKGKKAASQPTFVDVKAAPVIAVREKEDPNSTENSKGKIKEDVIAVMGVDEKGNDVATANTLTFAYSDTELKLTPAGSYVYAYSLDGGNKFSKITRETSVQFKKIDVAKGIIIRTEGTKEDTKKKIEGNWASNELTLPVPAAKVEITGKAEYTVGDTGETYKAIVKDALGQEIKDAKVSWSASTANSIVETTGVFTVPGTAGKVTITATYKDTTRGVEVKATLDVNVKDTAK